jgi:hypothetical protein
VADTLERQSRYACRSVSEILIVRLLMRDARSSPSAISFRIVEQAHWSLALTCATESSFETGMFLCSILILRASSTVKTLPVCYVIVRGAFSGVDGRFGQERAARFCRWKRLEILDRARVLCPFLPVRQFRLARFFETSRDSG